MSDMSQQNCMSHSSKHADSVCDHVLQDPVSAACGVNVLLCTSLYHLDTLWLKHAERGLVRLNAELTCAMQGP